MAAFINAPSNFVPVESEACSVQEIFQDLLMHLQAALWGMQKAAQSSIGKACVRSKML